MDDSASPAPDPRRDPGTPPDDAEAWTEEQWIAWLEATDDPAGSGGPGRASRRLRDSRPASMLGAAMLGLHDVIYGRPDEAVIVADAGGDPPGDDLPELHLDPEHPERSEVVIHRRPPPADSAGPATPPPAPG